MPTTIQPSFAKGEISPALHGRVDTSMYAVGLETARNVVIRKTGGADNRPGQYFVGPVKDHSYAPRLRRFEFKNSDTYILEFGDLYMRVIRNDAYVLEAAKTITGATGGNPVRVTVVGHGFVTGDQVYVTDVEGAEELNNRTFSVVAIDADTVDLVDQIFRTNVNGASYGAYTSGGTMARKYEIVTPYVIADISELKFRQSADVITIVHPNYPPYELARLGHDNWQLTPVEFEPGIAAPTNLAATPDSAASTEYSYTVTALLQTGEESLRGLNSTTKSITGATNANPVRVTAAAHNFRNDDEILIDGVAGMVELNGRRFTITNKDTDHFDLVGEDGTNHGIYSAGGTAQQTFVRITTGAATPKNTVAWNAVAGAAKYSVYRKKGGFFGVIGETADTSFLDDNLAPDVSITPPIQANPFRLEDDYPGAVGFHEQRRVFGGSVNQPDTSKFSKTGNYSNFTVSSPLQADDAITATLPAGQVNEIRHYVSGEDLLVFSSGSEVRVNSGSDSAFAPDSVRQRPASAWGASHAEPFRIGSQILYVHRSKLMVRSLGYSIQIDNYTGSDLTLLSAHLFGDVKDRRVVTLDEWAYARSPGSLIAGVKSDGTVAALTYEQEQEVLAWSRWDTEGWYERVEAIQPSQDEIEDAFYFVVKRFINGKVVRFVERTWRRRFSDVRDCFFLDAGMSYDSPISVTDVSGAGVITAPAHGLSVNDLVDVDDITWVSLRGDFGKRYQPDQLNTGRYKVTAKTTNTITLGDQHTGAALDTSEWTAYVSGGVVRKVVTEISGLHHLENTSVSILADGSVLPDQTVVDGKITVDGASRVHIGLPYVSDIGLLNIEIPGQTVQGKLKKIAYVTVRLDKSREIFVGQDEDHLTEMKLREEEVMGAPVQLFTGDRRIVMDTAWDSNGRLLFRQHLPLPMSVLAVIPTTDVETP